MSDTDDLNARMLQLTDEAQFLGSLPVTPENDSAMFRNITEGITVLEELLELGDTSVIGALFGARAIRAGYVLMGMHE